MNASHPTDSGTDQQDQAKLTEAQLGWLVAVKAAGLLPRTHIPVGFGGAISPLVKRGLLEWHKKHFLRLTEAGATAAQDYEQCSACGEPTHTQEAACIHCGKTKRWAQ